MLEWLQTLGPMFAGKNIIFGLDGYGRGKLVFDCSKVQFELVVGRSPVKTANVDRIEAPTRLLHRWRRAIHSGCLIGNSHMV